MAKKETEVAAKIGYPELTEADTPLYSNAILVNHTPWDFALHFSQIITPIRPPKTDGPLEIVGKKIAVISVPVTLVRGLITALQTNLDKYEQQYGKVEIPRQQKEKDGNGSSE
jgi:hypothetical protein